MPWDANIATTQYKYKLPLQSFNQLQAAIKERCQGAGVSVPSIFNSDMSKMSDMLPSNWFTLFQSTITTLISSYVNHTDNSGNWNGQTTIPAWTEAAILTAIGDASRLPAPSSRKCAAWCFQQFEILNLLRWAKWTDKTVTAYIRSVTTFDKTWAEAVSQFNSTSWSSTTSTMALHAAGITGSTPHARYDILRVKVLDTYTTSLLFNCSCDFYNKFASYGSYTYENNDYPASNNTWYKIDTRAIASGNSVTSESGNFGDVSATEPTTFSKGWTAPHNNGGIPQRIAILKFTGANGFTYKDW